MIDDPDYTVSQIKILESLNVHTAKDFFDHVQPCCVYKSVFAQGGTVHHGQGPHSTHSVFTVQMLCFALLCGSD